MDFVIKFEAKDLQKVKDILLKDDVTSRASMTFKDGKFVNLEGYFCYFSGTDEQVKRAKELVKETAKEAEQKESSAVIQKIKEEEQQAQSGFGAIFG